MKKAADEKKSNKKNFINILIIIILLLIGVFLYARYVEHTKLEVKEYRISSENIPSNFSGIKIIHLSDIYFGNTTDTKYIDMLVEKINKLNPDLILFTGNLYGNNIKKIDEYKESLSKLHSKLGKYASKGNKDYFDEYDSFMENIGFKVMSNNYELIYNEGLEPIFICGLNSSLKEEVNLDNCVNYFEENNNLNLYKIILAHEGDMTDLILSSKINPNLILSGNSLNGSVDIPYYGPLFLPNGSKKYYKEQYTKDNTLIFVSSGIGTDIRPYRLFNKPSFNFYRLKSLK